MGLLSLRKCGNQIPHDTLYVNEEATYVPWEDRRVLSAGEKSTDQRPRPCRTYLPCRLGSRERGESASKFEGPHIHTPHSDAVVIERERSQDPARGPNSLTDHTKNLELTSPTRNTTCQQPGAPHLAPFMNHNILPPSKDHHSPDCPNKLFLCFSASLTQLASIKVPLPLFKQIKEPPPPLSGT